mmetsp:Transcript_7336/g.25201  ORF Transcript_7336/g.25201 Transcript_7336/m.25201 type:complete len:99 (-) Transcript_7336:70-366(-)
MRLCMDSVRTEPLGMMLPENILDECSERQHNNENSDLCDICDILGITVERFESFSMGKKKALCSLALSIRYLTRQQELDGGNLDGKLLPCHKPFFRFE